jgi:uncharacterized membrane protein
MKPKNIGTMIGIAIVILIAAGLAWAGSRGGLKISGIPIFALCVGWLF